MSDSKVVALGGLTYEKEVVETTVKALERLLEQAKAGEIVGACYVTLGHDGLASRGLVGRVTGYSVVGGMYANLHQLTEGTLEEGG